MPNMNLQRAIEEGADFIETDILASKDGVLICFHDVTLDETTDIANHKEFSDRKRTYEVQGDNTTGFFTGIIPKQLELILCCHIFTFCQLDKLISLLNWIPAH